MKGDAERRIAVVAPIAIGLALAASGALVGAALQLGFWTCVAAWVGSLAFLVLIYWLDCGGNP